nr:Chain B, PGC-1a peptide [Homo sapiens]
SLLKKLLLA